MTDEQLAEYETWAQAWSRAESAGARRVLELVAEVRRLKAAAVPDPQKVTEDEIHAELVRKYGNRRCARPMIVQPAPLPAFPGILSGITAADVYGVQV